MVLHVLIHDPPKGIDTNASDRLALSCNIQAIREECCRFRARTPALEGVLDPNRPVPTIAIRDEPPGTPHGLEVPFIFGHVREDPEYGRPEPVELTAEDLRFGDVVCAYWVNFAKPPSASLEALFRVGVGRGRGPNVTDPA